MRALDGFLISLYQKLVNWTQRDKTWWLPQCAILLAVASVSKAFFSFSPGQLGILVLDGFMCWGIIAVSKSEMLITAFATSDLLRWFMVFLLFMCIFNAWIMPTPHQLADVVSQFAIVSAYYFVATMPPPPPKREHKLAMDMT